MSQMTSLQKAEKHCEKVSVLVATTVVATRNAHAPVGSGSSTSPAVDNFVKITTACSQTYVCGGDISCGDLLADSCTQRRQWWTAVVASTIRYEQACWTGMQSLVCAGRQQSRVETHIADGSKAAGSCRK